MTDFWSGYILLVIVCGVLSGLVHIAVLLTWAAGVKWIRDEQNPMR